jgi:tripeptidyl-peptidase-1
MLWSTGPLAAVLVHLLVGVSCSSIQARHVKYEVLEQRDSTPHAWTRRSRLDGDAVLPVRIALAQSNIHRAEEFILDVAGPSSPKYGQHWTPQQIAKTFAPSKETVEEVKEWLQAAGISVTRVSMVTSSGWLTFNATASEMEGLLNTEYHVYEHVETGLLQIASDTYSVPAVVRRYVEFITPTLHFGTAALIPRRVEAKQKAKTRDAKRATTSEKSAHSLAILGNTTTPGVDPNDLSNCSNAITLACLRYLYRIPDEPLTAPNNSIGIMEYGTQNYIESDLEMFFETYAPSLAGSVPVLHSIDGGAIGYLEDPNLNIESDLDFQYAMGLTAPILPDLFQTGDWVEGGNFQLFLDGVDASYCTYDGGDDPSYDPVYPDPKPGGYNGTRQCGVFKPSSVLSTSYSLDEYYITAAYATRQCHEYMKLGLMGVTVLYATGDWGVAGADNICIGQHGIQDVFRPQFPATCPYVTAVGGTQIAANASVTEPEIAVQDVVYSGGGFSNFFPIPSWQQSTLAAWWDEHKPDYSFQQFNNSRQTSGYPDVSANAANYIVAVDGDFTQIYGTSAATPVFASVITRINDARLNAGKTVVGFINPVLYEHPEVLNDITIGDNPGCRKNSHSMTHFSKPTIIVGSSTNFRLCRYEWVRGRCWLGSRHGPWNPELSQDAGAIHVLAIMTVNTYSQAVLSFLHWILSMNETPREF